MNHSTGIPNTLSPRTRSIPPRPMLWSDPSKHASKTNVETYNQFNGLVRDVDIVTYKTNLPTNCHLQIIGFPLLLLPKTQNTVPKRNDTDVCEFSRRVRQVAILYTISILQHVGNANRERTNPY